MATVTCPRCKRALNLPDHRDFELACCPSCRHAFAPPRFHSSLHPSPRRRNEFRCDFPRCPDAFPGSTIRMRLVACLWLSRKAKNCQAPSQRSEARRALESAGVWLRLTGWVGLCTTLPCCGTTGFLLTNTDLSNFVVYSLLLCVLGVAYASILIMGRSWRQQTSHDLAISTTFVALLTTSGLVFLNFGF